MPWLCVIMQAVWLEVSLGSLKIDEDENIIQAKWNIVRPCTRNCLVDLQYISQTQLQWSIVQLIRFFYFKLPDGVI